VQYLFPTPTERLLDTRDRPYFLWDCTLTNEEFKAHLSPDASPELREYFAAKLLRQAKPDDVFSYLTREDIVELWDGMSPYLGNKRDFWKWLLKISH
jgi:hypothetical protein